MISRLGEARRNYLRSPYIEPFGPLRVKLWQFWTWGFRFLSSDLFAGTCFLFNM